MSDETSVTRALCWGSTRSRRRAAEDPPKAPPAITTGQGNRRTPPRPRRPPALDGEAGGTVEVPLLVVQEVAEEALRDRLRQRGLAALRPDRVAAAHGVELGDDPRVGERGRSDGRRQRLEQHQHDGHRDERHHVRDRGQGPELTASPYRRLARAAAPRDRGELGERAGLHGCAYPPAMARRRMTVGASAGSSRTCVAWPGPSL